MVSDAVYELCQPILQDSSLEEEDKTDKLEELLRKETSLTGRPLSDAILGILWRHRDAHAPPPAAPTSPPTRHALASVARRGSPAPWQMGRASTPVASPSLAGASPASSFAGIHAPPGFSRAKSSTASPFTSPRPSPRLAFTSPIPHSPSLHSYEFSEPSRPDQGDYGDYGSDTVDWLVADDEASRPTSSGAGSAFESNLSAAAPAWVQPQQSEMSPYDMLRSVLGESKTDDEIEYALEQNNYDLSATIAAFMGGQGMYEDQNGMQSGEGQLVIGKSMLHGQPIPIGGQGNGQGRSNVICKYWLQTGNCLRADCRFSHDFGNHVCKYWVMGTCLAGETCVFSHDPSTLMANLNLGNNSTDSAGNVQPSFQVQDYDAFPVLQSAMLNNQAAQNQFTSHSYNSNASGRAFASSNLSSHIYSASPSNRSYGSRPTSRHSSRAPTPSIPQVDDAEAFPTLGAATVKIGKKHHGKRGGHGHGHQNKENNPSGSLAEVVRMSPGPRPGLPPKGLTKSRSYLGNKETNAAASAITPPEHIPWLETGEKSNQAYIKARQDAFKHGGLRNKFLQSAAQAWNRNDARAAKALSLRGQSENDLMRKAHREAARHLYESRTTPLSSPSSSDKRPPRTALPPPTELYVDLHGLHPEEAVAYLSGVLQEQRAYERPVYAITGTGHHSKGGKDKVGKAVRMWLGGRGVAFREFSVPGDRGNVGGILGIDARTGDVGSPKEEEGKGREEGEGVGVGVGGKEGEEGMKEVGEKQEVVIPKGPRLKS